ncbi:helix-turn-helix domain-containing protein [Brevibacterium senegalense]|uniref:helix-turn-helix domain-containing protein n=1 Tax=Brevibacterium senegalense TaxID=1033736 RepID=UPI0002F84C71|nr:helix-turn-helix domain-containing protein [Brevibacterium senegalense]
MQTHTRLVKPSDLPDRYTLLRRPEAAAHFHRATKTLDRWIADGAMPCIRIGPRVLIRRSTVTAYLDALNPEAPAHRGEATAMPTGEVYISLNNAAAVLGLHRNTVDELTRSGDLPRLRFGRSRVIPVAALADLIDTHAVPATVGPLAGRDA